MSDSVLTSHRPPTRRQAAGMTAGITAAIALGALSPARPARAQQPPAAAASSPRPKGPRVWLDYDQTDLDDGLNTLKAAPNLRQVTGRWASNSEAVRQRLGPPRRLAYGPTPIEALDLYPTRAANAPINVFLHGGGFELGLARHYAFAAEMFVRAGAHHAVPDFARAQDHGGDIAPLVDQALRAIAWVHRNARSFGGDPDRIFVAGHSTGGELTGLALTTDWRAEFGLPADLVKGGLCCSTVFDLRALRLSSRGAGLKFTDESEAAFSTRRRLDRLRAPVIVAFGSLETPLFQNQSREFVAAAKAAGKPATLLVAEGYNHFEVIETLANPYGPLGRAALEQMGLVPA